MKKRTPWQIQRAVIFALLMRELKTRFGGHWTGVVWLLGLPLVQVFMMVAMNTYLRGRLHAGLYEYAIFLLVALIPFRMSTGLWTQLMNAPQANQGLFNYRQVTPMDALAARALLELVLESSTFVLVMLIMARLGYTEVLPWHLLDFLTVWLVYFFLGAGMGLTLAGLNGPVPRLGTFVQILSMPLYLLSGVLFALPKAPPPVGDWLQLNPMMHLVECGRAAYLPGYVLPQGLSLGYPAMWALTLCFLGMSLCRWRRAALAAGE